MVGLPAASTAAVLGVSLFIDVSNSFFLLFHLSNRIKNSEFRLQPQPVCCSRLLSSTRRTSPALWLHRSRNQVQLGQLVSVSKSVIIMARLQFKYSG